MAVYSILRRARRQLHVLVGVHGEIESDELFSWSVLERHAAGQKRTWPVFPSSRASTHRKTTEQQEKLISATGDTARAHCSLRTTSGSRAGGRQLHLSTTVYRIVSETGWRESPVAPDRFYCFQCIVPGNLRRRPIAQRGNCWWCRVPLV